MAVSDCVTIMLNRHIVPYADRGHLGGADDDGEWRCPMAELLSDDRELCLSNESLDDPMALTEEELDRFCGLVVYI